MYAASPGLHGVEHPIYDIWLNDCKGPETTVVTAAPDAPRQPTPAQQPAQKRQPAQPRQTAPRPPAQLPPPQPQQQTQQQPPPPPPPQQGGLFGIFR
jgi:hypothetical protein